MDRDMATGSVTRLTPDIQVCKFGVVSGKRRNAALTISLWAGSEDQEHESWKADLVN